MTARERKEVIFGIQDIVIALTIYFFSAIYISIGFFFVD
jgi:hypothetical protein